MSGNCTSKAGGSYKSMRVVITADYETLSREAADLVVSALKAKPNLTLGLPTGTTPAGMYKELVRRHREDALDLSRIRTFNLDEYLDIPSNHPYNFHTYMRVHFFEPAEVALAQTDIPN